MNIIETARTPDTQEKITVVINNFNYGRFLKTAILSALNQPDVIQRVIVVDDGSSDDSISIIREFGSKIVPLYLKNCGQLNACLSALPLVTTQYVHFLDSDDELTPEFGREIAAVLSFRPAKIQMRLRTIDENGIFLNCIWPPYPRRYSSAKMQSDIRHWGWCVSPPTSGNVFSMDLLMLLAQNPCKYERFIDGVILYIAPFIGKVITLNKALVNYRVHGSNIFGQNILNESRLENEINRTRYRRAHLTKIVGHAPCIETNEELGGILEWKIMIQVTRGLSPNIRDVFWYCRKLFRTSFPMEMKATLTGWVMLLMLMPPSIRTHLCLWRLSSVNRPDFVNKFLAKWRPIDAQESFILPRPKEASIDLTNNSIASKQVVF